MDGDDLLRSGKMDGDPAMRRQLTVAILSAARNWCSACGKRKETGTLKKCSGCLDAMYCDTACQKKHWFVALFCNALL